MAKHQPFIIPAGVSIQLTDRGVSIHHAGDIILRDSLGDTMNQIVSREGSVTLAGSFQVDEISAPRGTVNLQGTVKARAVRGSVVEVLTDRFEVASVQGAKRITLGATRVSADVLVAPRIDIDPKASGRVPIIECRNEPGPNAIKGGFSIAEYDELVGNVSSFLAERGVEPLEPGEEDGEQEDDEEPSDVVIEAYAADEAEIEALDDEQDGEAGEAVDEATEDPDTYTDSSALKVGVATAAPVEPVLVEPDVAPEPDQPDEPEPLPGPGEGALSRIESDDLQLPAGAKAPADEADEIADEIADVDVEELADERIAQVDETFEDVDAGDEPDSAHAQLLEILEELRSCYDDGEHPPVLAELAELVDSRQYDEIVSRLPQIWNDLVKYHRERGLRIRRQVTTTFNNIMTIVKNAPSVTLGQQ
jgi:hypothetical protein